MKADDDPDPFYTSLCSERTLQSDRKGFFMDYAQQVSEAVGSRWVDDVFAKLTTDRDRISICYEDAEVREAVVGPLRHIHGVHRGKSASVSQQRRADADQYLRAGLHHRALMLYSQAVVRAPPAGKDMTVDDGLSLAHALAARSEALMITKDYGLSITDIQLAIKEGFPIELRYQLYWRMARCYKAMNQTPKARISLQLASRLLNQHASHVGPEAIVLMMKINEEMAELECSENSVKAIEPSEEVTGAMRATPELTGGPNPDVEHASRLIGVSRSEVAGRFIMAQEPVRAGDTLVVEDAYAACLLPDKFGSNCHHCFSRLKAPVACPNCSGLAFCSTTCRDISCQSYHKYECEFMDLLIGSGMSILCHVGLRMVTQSGLQFFTERREKIMQPTGAVSRGDRYMEVYNLVTHSDKRSAKDFFQRTVMAIFLLTYLQKAGFFSSTSLESTALHLSEDELLIGSLLLHHLQLLQFNAHEVYETHVEAPKKFRTGRTVYIGVAIYSTVALFNHDCYPAVARYFKGRSIVIRAVRPLEPGDVVAENYGPVFTKRPLIARQKALFSRYWFHCSCTACREDWPLMEKLENDTYTLRCSTPGCRKLQKITKRKQSYKKCSACKKKVSAEEALSVITECENIYTHGLQEMEEGFPEKAIPLFCSYIDAMHKVCVPPHKVTVLCQEALRICMADNGNVLISGLQKM